MLELKVKLLDDKDAWFEQYQADWDARVAAAVEEGRSKRRTGAERVYFVQSPGTGLIKIGVSNAVASRLKALQTSAGETLEFLGTEAGGYRRESELHRRFAHLRVGGEWFVPESDLLDYIQSERIP